MNKWTTWGLILTALILPVVAFGKKSTSGNYYYTDEFINAVKTAVGNLNIVQEDSAKKIINYYFQAGYENLSQLCYILATAWHECSLVSKKEIRCNTSQACYWLQENYWYTGYFGRGFVQLTGESNYEEMSSIVGIDLVTYPDMALEPNTAAKIIVEGMQKGTFTGVKLSNYINDDSIDFYNARKVVNGLQNADNISDTAFNILTSLPVL